MRVPAELSRIEGDLRGGACGESRAPDDLRAVGVVPTETFQRIETTGESAFNLKLMPHHLGGVLGRVLVPCHIIRWVERRAGPEKIDHSPEAIDNHLIHSTITDGTCDLRTLGRITRIVPVVVRQVHIGRVAVLQDLLDTLVHSGPAYRAVVHLSRLGRSQHERDTPHIPVNALACERAEQVKMKPGSETEGASLLTLPENPVSLEIDKITGVVADVVLKEKIQIVDGRVVIVPLGCERIVAHPGITL